MTDNRAEIENEIKITVATLKENLAKFSDYDEVEKFFDRDDNMIDGCTSFVNRFYTDDPNKPAGFDLDFGNMGFTIYRADDNSFYLNQFASYYLYDEADDETDIIDVDINKLRGQIND